MKDKGISKESRTVSLLKMLDGVKSVKLAKTGSAMDCELKADVMVELEDGRCGLIQVKSSRFFAEKHMEENEIVEYNNELYDGPGVFWYEEESNLQALEQLSEMFKLPIRQDIVDALAICDKMVKGDMTLNMKIVIKMFGQPVFDAMCFLCRIHIQHGRDVKFI